MNLKNVYRNTLTAKTLLVIGGLLFIIAGFNQRAAAQVGGAAIAAIDEQVAGSQAIEQPGKSARPIKKNAFPVTTPPINAARKKSTVTPSIAPPKNRSSTAARRAVKPDDGFVVGDEYTFLNFEIAQPVAPIYRKAAKDAGAVGLVRVIILIDQNGNVLKAKAASGNQLLRPEAEKAALATKFNRPTVYGKPAKAMGFIVFRFGTLEDENKQEMKDKAAGKIN